jgi:hypothetical protein
MPVRQHRPFTAACFLWSTLAAAHFTEN